MEIEIKVMWCKGITAFNFFQKLTLYASVSIKCEDHRLELTSDQIQEQKTPIDEDGGGDPEWNHTMVFDLSRLNSVSPNLEHLSFLFEFRHRGQFLGDKTVGDVSVPLRSLIDSAGFNVTRFVSYEVRSPDGKHNGILDFSYKVVGKSVGLMSSTGNVPSEIHISGYTNSEVEGQIIQHDHQRYQLDVQTVQSSSASEVDRIEYPRIDLDDWSASSSSALVATNNVSHYPPPAQAVYPPRPFQQHQWGPLPQQPHYFPPLPPPPPPPPVVYPPRPYEGSHWGYYRPPSDGCDGCHRW